MARNPELSIIKESLLYCCWISDTLLSLRGIPGSASLRNVAVIGLLVKAFRLTDLFLYFDGDIGDERVCVWTNWIICQSILERMSAFFF